MGKLSINIFRKRLCRDAIVLYRCSRQQAQYHLLLQSAHPRIIKLRDVLIFLYKLPSATMGFAFLFFLILCAIFITFIYLRESIVS